MKKKLFAMAVLLGFTLSTILSGCGSDKQASDTNAGQTQQSSQSAESKKDPVNIKILTYEGSKAGNDYVWDVGIKAFEAKNPDIKVTLDLQAENNSTEFLKKLDLMLLSGDTSDLIQISNFQSHAERALKDLFVPMDDFMAKEGIKFEDKYDTISKVNDKYYAVPLNPSMYFVLINKNYLDAAGLSAPKVDWTWNEYREYAKKMTKGEGKDKVYGSYMHTWPEYKRFAMWNVKMDNPFLKDDGSSNLDSPVFKNWLQFMSDMENVDKSQIPYFEAKSTKMAYRDVFFQGKVAMIPTGSWMISEMKDQAKYPHDFQTVVASMPTWEGGAAGRTEGGYSYLSINSKSKNPEAAYKFARFMTNEGAVATNAYIPSEKGADLFTSYKAILGTENESLFDMDSLQAVVNNPARQLNSIYKEVENFKPLDEFFDQEAEKFLVGGQSLDETMKNIQTKGNELITKK